MALGALVAATLAGVLEALGLASLLPVLGTRHTMNSDLYVAFGVLGAFLVASIAVRGISDVITAQLNVAVDGDLRRRFLAGLVDARWSALREARSGDLVTALMSESSQIANGTTAYVSSLSALSIAVTLGTVGVVVAPVLAVIAVGFTTVSFVAYRRAGRLSRRNQVAFAVAASEMNEEAVSLLANLKMLLSTGKRTSWLAEMHSRLTELLRRRRRDLVIPILTRSTVEAFGTVFLISTMVFTVARGGQASDALVTLAIFYRVIPRLQSAQAGFLVARTQSVWWERWQARDASWTQRDDRSGVRGELQFIPPLFALELRSAGLSYPGRAMPALDRVSLELQAGRVLAVVGPTGSGKSTLLDIVTGLVSPDTGCCLVNGVPLAELDLDSWQRRIGFVPQDAPVMQGTLLHNLAWLEGDLDREWAEEVIAYAALETMVAELPAGLETMVGPRGTSISGGQRQRLAIARALYRRPMLLILDEATSGLDPATEQLLLGNLKSHCKDMAVIMVTHRLQTIGMADAVAVLDAGILVSLGPSTEVPSNLLGRLGAMAGGPR